MRKHRIVLFFVFVLLARLMVPAADGKVYINIDSPSAPEFPTAITPFKNMNNASAQESLLGSPIPWERRWRSRGSSTSSTARPFSSTRPSSISTENIQFPAWTDIGAESLVTGGFTVSGRDLTLECRLFDVVQGKLIVGKRYTGKLEAARMVVRFAQEILVALTGRKGLFDTKIAFTGKKSGSSEIYYVNFDGTEPVNSRTTAPSRAFAEVVARRQADFVSFVQGRRPRPPCHGIPPTAGRHGRSSPRAVSIFPLTWSTDSYGYSTLSKDGSEDIYILNLADSRMTRLTNDPAIDVSPPGPHGKQVAFVSDREVRHRSTSWMNGRQCPEAHLRRGLQHLTGLASPFQSHRL